MERTQSEIDLWSRPLDEVLISIQRLGHWNAKLRTIFDATPILEVREACLAILRPPSDEDSQQWLFTRIDQFNKTGDYRTLTMLFRCALGCNNDEEFIRKVISRLIARLRQEPKWQDTFKELLVMLCGKLYHHPEFYNDGVREFFCETIKSLDRRGKYGTCEREARILQRVIRLIGKFGDTSFLPLLKEYLPDSKDTAHLMEYADTCPDELALEGLRLIVIQYLEHLQRSAGIST